MTIGFPWPGQQFFCSRPAFKRRWVAVFTGAILVMGHIEPTRAAETAPPTGARAGLDPTAVLGPGQWERVTRSMDRALAWIANMQQPDGSFPTLDVGQPAVTSLCVMAFMSRGHLPGQGPYGVQIDKAIDYVLSCQHEDGLLSFRHPAQASDILKAQTAAYNHPISGLMLSEAYGMTTGSVNRKIRPALEKAVALTMRRVPDPKRHKADSGGWRYMRRWQSSDSDLSVTSWHLMFLRSCRNAGFDVPASEIEKSLGFVRRCFEPKQGVFWYALRGREKNTTRGMTGAGILSLSLGGQHQTKEALHAGQWVLEHPFDKYMGVTSTHDRFFYGAFYCSHAMFQLGDRYWKGFYPTLVKTLVSHQRVDGSWDKEKRDAKYGNVYSSAMAVLALSPPCQLLPIFQR